MLAAVLVLLAGCALRADPSGAPAELTSAIATDGDPAVVAIVYAADPTQLRCTGTLISERVVITAAHCTARMDPASLRVVAGAELDRAVSGTAILEAVTHPAFDDTADHDLALLLLAEPSTAAPVELSAAPPAPGSVRLVGFGITAPGAEDDDRKREGGGRIAEVTPQHVVLAADPSLPCSGDSGGPVLVTTATGERIAAVISRGDAECSATSRATRVDAHLAAFIQPRLDAWAAGSIALAAPCLYDAHCESGLCAAALDEPALRFCGSACADDADCEAPLACQVDVCRHPWPTPGALGSACTAHDECLRGDCLAEEAICSERCVSGRDDCPFGFACSHLGGVDFYCLPVAESPGTCAVSRGPRGPSAVPLAALALALLAAWRRRRRVFKF